MTNFKVVCQRMTCILQMLDMKIGKIAAAVVEEQDQDKNYGPEKTFQIKAYCCKAKFKKNVSSYYSSAMAIY